MHVAMMFLARLMAGLGGVMLTLLIGLTCVSVIGRSIGLGPVRGDYELVEAGIAFAIFAFLPWCQLRGAHASVDIFTSALPPRTNRWIAAFWEVVFAAVLILMAVQLHAGMQGKLRNGETTFLLQLPVWWAYAASLAAAVTAALVGVYAAAIRLRGAAGGDDPLAHEGAGP